MIPALASDPVAAFSAEIEQRWPGRLAGLYLVGGLALADFSPRQSNIDLVVVCEPALEDAERAAVLDAQRRLARAGRPAGVWHTGWEELAGAERSGQPLDTPLTRALLQEEAVVVAGPDWPVIAFDPDEYRAWCRRQLGEIAGGHHGVMILRRDVTPLVLQAARLAQGAVTGRVFSKSEAGETATSLIPAHFRRILQDAVGYRNGANTSMYWGPFERKYDARRVIEELWRAVRTG